MLCLLLGVLWDYKKICTEDLPSEMFYSISLVYLAIEKNDRTS